jgi:hypothetical protein
MTRRAAVRPLPPARTTATVPAEIAPDWDAFEPEVYWKNNYAFLRGDDRRFIERLRALFGAEVAKTRPAGRPRRGIDVGSGANLYPALAMLPLCDEITLLEYGAKNCEWLRGEVARYSTYWDPCWRLLREHEAYAEIGTNARRRLTRTARVTQGSLFDLPSSEEPKYDVGTMFFVAESITDQENRFYEALDAFVGALVPGAPFAAAFMRNSNGYVVDNQAFPALKIDENHVAEYLKKIAPDVRVEVVDDRGRYDNDPAVDKRPTRRLRHGYDGMILALGHVK